MREFEIRTDPVQINAPIDVVWGVLTEVDKYHEWNPCAFEEPRLIAWKPCETLEYKLD